MKNITAIILAAGESKRIKSNTSKIFHELADQPLIHHVYSTAKKVSNNIIIVCNRKNVKIINEKFPNAQTVIQKYSKGTADAVLSAKKLAQSNKNNRILILYADVPLITANTIKKLLTKYRKTKNTGSVLIFNSKNPKGYGRVETNNLFIKKIIEEVQCTKETKKIRLCNSGIMISNKNYLFKNILRIKNDNIKKEKFLTDIIKIAFDDKRPFTFSICNEEELQGVNSREDLIKLDNNLQQIIKQKLIKNGVTLLQPQNVRVSFDTAIGKDTVIEPFVVIKKGVRIKKDVIIKSNSVIENCLIDDGSSIGPSARIRPKSKIGKKVKIGNYVEIKNSIIGENTSISHLSYIGDSKVGKNVNIGAGTITCNYDGVKKNKTIIKDNVFIGSNSSIIAPLTIGKNSRIGAGSVITKNVPADSLAIERSKQKNLSKKKY